MVDESQLPGTFEGIICAAGAYVEYQGKVIRALKMPAEKLDRLCAVLDREHIVYSVQCTDHILYMKNHLQEIGNASLSGRELTAEQIEMLEKALKIVEDYQNILDAEKVLYYNSKLSPEQLEERLGPDYHVTLPRIM